MISPRELERVYTEHGAALYAYLLNLSRSEAVSGDLLQELFLKLSRRSALTWKFVRHRRRYLLRAAYSLFVDHCRREKTRLAMLEEAGKSLSLFATEPTTDEVDGKLIGDLLGALPPEQRAVVHLKIWEELTFREIAAVLNIPADTAASRYRYALDKLRAGHRQYYENRE